LAPDRIPANICQREHNIWRNPNADALHPDAIYRLNIDNDGDLLTDVAFSYVFSKPQNGKQTFSVFLAKEAESRSDPR
jgi:hypothetical protein